MNGRLIFRILAAVVLIAALAGVGVMVFNAGVARGLAVEGNLPVPEGTEGFAGRGFYPHYGYGGPFIRPWGFGFAPFGCLIPLLFIFLFFALIRGAFFRGWYGPRFHGWDGPHQVPPGFEEWHRRAHGQEPEKKDE